MKQPNVALGLTMRETLRFSLTYFYFFKTTIKYEINLMIILKVIYEYKKNCVKM